MRCRSLAGRGTHHPAALAPWCRCVRLGERQRAPGICARAPSLPLRKSRAHRDSLWSSPARVECNLTGEAKTRRQLPRTSPMRGATPGWASPRHVPRWASAPQWSGSRSDPEGRILAPTDTVPSRLGVSMALSLQCVLCNGAPVHRRTGRQLSKVQQLEHLDRMLCAETATRRKCRHTCAHTRKLGECQRSSLRWRNACRRQTIKVPTRTMLCATNTHGALTPKGSFEPRSEGKVVPKLRAPAARKSCTSIPM